ncbi:uncharacterized protein MYCFIDRAFT_212137 [Pseudocercospora fijiensis CIRAD86]|uniref:SnoaL-like domain-containing protein n=1 Tax=Pseudocercospora fijiensis (strain CIRAD86) TaxID=383855 RepID=M3A3A8_PSEFD|nr:uncharacterized protein MYCFIDRAFT_212137 [Pseudocercospora fijiensis CIRAD86]EME79126.1 hypothetical protein MYCFIDRAFT_212137 [Pseudocercospora fijiensis CIRAD86]
MAHHFTAQDIHQLGRRYNPTTTPSSAQISTIPPQSTPHPPPPPPQKFQPQSTLQTQIPGTEPPTDPLDLKSFLERTSPIGLHIINNRDFSTSNTHPSLCHLHPSHEIHFDNYPSPLTWDEYMNISEKLVQENSKYRLELKGIDSDIDEVSGRATVHMEIEIFGLSGTERMAGVSSVEWERDETGRWWAISAVGMRGSEIGGGFV